MNGTTQQEKITQLGSRNETTQISRRKQTNSSVGMKQLNSVLPSTTYSRLQPPSTAYNHQQPPATACIAFTAESAFSTYLYTYIHCWTIAKDGSQIAM
ncbi:hypothetical protein TNCV_2983931 [Trichonephila clavipes]|nr:hypothetical protein TNCV_2983931 [Trichonephila clavipes]